MHWNNSESEAMYSNKDFSLICFLNPLAMVLDHHITLVHFKEQY